MSNASIFDNAEELRTRFLRHGLLELRVTQQTASPVADAAKDTLLATSGLRCENCGASIARGTDSFKRLICCLTCIFDKRGCCCKDGEAADTVNTKEGEALFAE